jgi:hypothetical protein
MLPVVKVTVLVLPIRVKERMTGVATVAEGYAV